MPPDDPPSLSGMEKRRLTLGKFAPLHRGHEYLIETALSEMDALWVIIYDCPETFHVPLNVRAGWLRRRYPGIRVIEAWDGPTVVGDTPGIRHLHESYVIRQLGIRGVTHFYSSEFYGGHMSRALGAVDRRVDPRRRTVPISATAIRAEPYANRRFLDPLVYRDLVVNVVLLGAPSTGKTTLAARLAERYDTLWMPEYGREYWIRHQVDRRLAPGQLLEIAKAHLIREDALLEGANRYLFTDTNAITTYTFAMQYHGHALPELAALADGCHQRYDIVLLCDTDIPHADTWDRSGAAARRAFQKRLLAELHSRRIPYALLQGDLEARTQQASRILSGFQKYMNPARLKAGEDRHRVERGTRNQRC